MRIVARYTLVARRRKVRFFLKNFIIATQTSMSAYRGARAPIYMETKKTVFSKNPESPANRTYYRQKYSIFVRFYIARVILVR